jgi:hypothetical protein
MDRFASSALSKNVGTGRRKLPFGILGVGALLGVAGLVAVSLPSTRILDGVATAQSPTKGPADSAAEERVLYDFAGRNLLIYGIYSAKLHGKKNGIEAENSARREGKQTLTDHLTSVCQASQLGSDWQESLRLRKDWSPSVLTSLGSEIFPQATLLIRLQAPFSSIFSQYPSAKLAPVQNTAKESFVFKVPPIPAALMSCGTVEVRIAPTRVIRVAPGYAGQVPPGTTVISLAVTKERLEPATAADAASLKRSEFGVKQDASNETNNNPPALPLYYKAVE